MDWGFGLDETFGIKNPRQDLRRRRTWDPRTGETSGPEIGQAQDRPNWILNGTL